MQVPGLHAATQPSPPVSHLRVFPATFTLSFRCINKTTIQLLPSPRTRIIVAYFSYEQGVFFYFCVEHRYYPNLAIKTLQLAVINSRNNMRMPKTRTRQQAKNCARGNTLRYCLIVLWCHTANHYQHHNRAKLLEKERELNPGWLEIGSPRVTNFNTRSLT